MDWATLGVDRCGVSRSSCPSGESARSSDCTISAQASSPLTATHFCKRTQRILAVMVHCTGVLVENFLSLFFVKIGIVMTHRLHGRKEEATNFSRSSISCLVLSTRPGSREISSLS